MSVFVLWEDKSLGPVASFGPHQLLVACVASRLVVIDRYALMRSQAIGGKPCSGNSNVLRALRQEPLGNSARHVIAVLDTDKLHDRLPGISSRGTIPDSDYPAWSDSVTIEVRKLASVHVQSKLEVCLLDRNLETLLSLVGRSMPALPAAVERI